MTKFPVVVKNDSGKDGRPIALFLVQEASQYSSRINIEMNDKQINAKSIMGMMSLTLAAGDELVVSVDGADEADAADGLKAFFQA